MSIFGVILVHIFLHSDQNNSEYGDFARSPSYLANVLSRYKYTWHKKTFCTLFSSWFSMKYWLNDWNQILGRKSVREKNGLPHIVKYLRLGLSLIVSGLFLFLFFFFFFFFFFPYFLLFAFRLLLLLQVVLTQFL